MVPPFSTIVTAGVAPGLPSVGMFNQPPGDEGRKRFPLTSLMVISNSFRREYAVIEFDDSHSPWTKLRRVPVLEVSSKGVNYCTFGKISGSI